MNIIDMVEMICVNTAGWCIVYRAVMLVCV